MNILINFLSRLFILEFLRSTPENLKSVHLLALYNLGISIYEQFKDALSFAFS